MAPKVSVIVPNYNHAPYLKQRLDSIFNQTFQDFEVIILDDCSTDNSKEIIEQYRSTPKVSHIAYNERNSGSPFKQWTKGFDLAQGEYIWIAESDDWAEPIFLETLIQPLENNTETILAFSASVINQDSTIIKAFSTETTLDGKSFIKKRMILENGIPNASAVLFRKKILCQISDDYQDFQGSGDCLFWIYLCEQGNVFFTPILMNHFRQHNHNTTTKCLINGTKFEEAFKINLYLKKKHYISNRERKYLALRKIESINEIEKQVNFERNQVKNIWKQPFFCYPIESRLMWLKIMILSLFFKLHIKKDAKDVPQQMASSLPLVFIIWKLFLLPHTNIRLFLLGRNSK